MPYKNKSDAIKYNSKFNEEHYERISLVVPIGKKEIIKAKAKDNKESLNSFINRAIDELLEKE